MATLHGDHGNDDAVRQHPADRARAQAFAVFVSPTSPLAQLETGLPAIQDGAEFLHGGNGGEFKGQHKAARDTLSATMKHRQDDGIDGFSAEYNPIGLQKPHDRIRMHRTGEYCQLVRRVEPDRHDVLTHRGSALQKPSGGDSQS